MILILFQEERIRRIGIGKGIRPWMYQQFMEVGKNGTKTNINLLVFDEKFNRRA